MVQNAPFARQSPPKADSTQWVGSTRALAPFRVVLGLVWSILSPWGQWDHFVLLCTHNRSEHLLLARPPPKKQQQTNLLKQLGDPVRLGTSLSRYLPNGVEYLAPWVPTSLGTYPMGLST